MCTHRNPRTVKMSRMGLIWE